jgi:hypothetical protein
VQIISSSVDYDFLNQAIHNDPIWIRAIQFQSPIGILSNAIQWQKIDANGKQMNQFDIPVNDISAYQAQGNIANIRYKNLKIDGRTTLQLALPTSQSIDLLIDYEQFKKTDLFSTQEPQSVLSEQEILSGLPKESTMKMVKWDERANKLLPAKKMFNIKDFDDNFTWD